MSQPQLINGGAAIDDRGEVQFNNELDLTSVKRMYSVSNKSLEFKRGWQGHMIEQRWFTSIIGKFEIHLVNLENFSNNKSYHFKYLLNDAQPQTLYVPPGYMSCIQATSIDNKLLIFADYKMDEIDDEYRFDLGRFNIFEF